MKQSMYLGEDLFPPFTGFPREGVAFLRQLRKNNNREWFNRNKSKYEEFVKQPMQSLIASLKQPMSYEMPEMLVDPKRSMFRIYRDTRFSKNKEPYKTHAAALFNVNKHWQSSAGYYVHIEPSGVYVGGGIYMPDANNLKRIRTSIADDPKRFLMIVSDDTFVKKFRKVEGEKLQRVPLGFPRDHMMAEWLKYKSFYTGVEWEVEASYSTQFVKKIMKAYKELLPLVRFLNGALGI